MIRVIIIAQYISVGSMGSRTAKPVTKRYRRHIAGGSIMGRCADVQLIDRNTLAAADTLIVDIYLVRAGIGEYFIVSIGVVGGTPRQFEAVQDGDGVFVAVDRIDLDPPAIGHRGVKPVRERKRGAGTEFEQRGIDARTFGGAGAGAGYHGPITLYGRGPSAAIDVEVGKEPAPALQKAFYIGKLYARPGIEVVSNGGRSFSKQRL